MEQCFVFLEAFRVFGGVSTGAGEWRPRPWQRLKGMEREGGREGQMEGGRGGSRTEYEGKEQNTDINCFYFYSGQFLDVSMESPWRAVVLLSRHYGYLALSLFPYHIGQ